MRARAAELALRGLCFCEGCCKASPARRKLREQRAAQLRKKLVNYRELSGDTKDTSHARQDPRHQKKVRP